MIHQTPTTELEDQQDSILLAITAALVTIHSIAWKTAQHFSYGARGFMRVPVSEANDINYLLGVIPAVLIGSHDKTIECATASLSRKVGQ
jgi:hypothetical protein